MAETAVELTDDSFAGFIDKGVALVDFWGPHCPPCLVQGPIVDEVAKRFTGRVAVGKVDVEANSKAPSEFGLMYIPTLIIFKDGKEWKRFTGLKQEDALTSELEDALEQE